MQLTSEIPMLLCQLNLCICPPDIRGKQTPETVALPALARGSHSLDYAQISSLAANFFAADTPFLDSRQFSLPLAHSYEKRKKAGRVLMNQQHMLSHRGCRRTRRWVRGIKVFLGKRKAKLDGERAGLWEGAADYSCMRHEKGTLSLSWGR